MEDGGGRESDKPPPITEGAMFRVFLAVAIAWGPIILVGPGGGAFWGARCSAWRSRVGIGIGPPARTRARRAEPRRRHLAAPVAER